MRLVLVALVGCGGGLGDDASTYTSGGGGGGGGASGGDGGQSVDAMDDGGGPLAQVRVLPSFKLNRASAVAWAEGGFRKPAER